MTVEFIYEREKAIIEARTILEKNNIQIEGEKDLNYGHKFICANRLGIIVYFKGKQSSKIVTENDNDSIGTLFESSATPEKDDPDKITRIQIYASFNVSDKNISSIKDELLETFVNIKIEFKEGTTKSIQYIMKVSDGQITLTITQFKNGTILLQGIDSNLVTTVKAIINKYDRIGEIENALGYAPEATQKEISAIIEKLENGYSSLLIITKEKISNEAYEFLFDNDKQELVSGIGIFEALKNTAIKLPSYNWLVYPFGKVFEGFLIRLMIDKKMFTFEEFSANPDIAHIGNSLQKDFYKRYIRDLVRNGFILRKLQTTWESLRCAQLHSDPGQSTDIITLTNISQAENKIGEICSCITDAYRILISEGLTEEQMLSKTTSTILSSNPTSSSPVEKDIPKLETHIGTDESGKGDYFGPLVIAGVYVDSAIVNKLERIGVKDSKQNSDTKNHELAEKIKRILSSKEYSIIYIMPEKYNELYSKMNNMNSMLAWGHARAIENILEGTPCENAIADQFGNEDYIKQAMLQKGKKINLFQTTKAERDIAVAAASILARDTFLLSMQRLSAMVGFNLHKGSSNEVEDDAKRIIATFSEQELMKFAKLHFKTTKKIKEV